MTRDEFKDLWHQTLRSADRSGDKYERLASCVVELHRDDENFGKHVRNRSGRVTKATGQAFDADNFDLDMARAFIADELGFDSWRALMTAIADGRPDDQPVLVRYAVAALWRGDFTALDNALGHDEFHNTITEWHQRGYFDSEPEPLAEAFAAACWLGHTETVRFLLDRGVDPYAGMRTGLSGFHWAASRPQPGVIRLLLSRGVPTEVKNMYDGTVLGQALWSAINEFTPGHAEVIELLIEGGAHVWPETLEWWEAQPVPDAETRLRVADALRRHRDRAGS